MDGPPAAGFQGRSSEVKLEPPVRAPHTVYMKSLYRIGGRPCGA